MPAIVSCPSCGKKYKVPGKSFDEFECTGCGATVASGEPPAALGRGRAGGGVRSRQRDAEAHRGGQSTGLWMGLGIVGLVLVVVVVILVATRDKGPKDRGLDPIDLAGAPPPRPEPPPDTTRPPPARPGPGTTEPGTTEPDTPLRPGPGPTRPGPGPARPEPEPPKDDLRTLDWPDIQVKLRALDAPDGTSSELRAEMAKLVATLLDFTSGGDGLTAQKRLVEIGKPAVPLLLKGTAGLDFSTMEGRSTGYMVDDALRQITRYVRIQELKPPIEDPRVWQRVFKYRLIWWENRKKLEGDAFPEPIAPDEGDEEETSPPPRRK